MSAKNDDTPTKRDIPGYFVNFQHRFDAFGSKLDGQAQRLEALERGTVLRLSTAPGLPTADSGDGSMPLGVTSGMKPSVFNCLYRWHATTSQADEKC